ncbi:selenide, water dikinase [Ureibacillus massiliensis 4400831 = CIP 108448 = CCUG 49529]|uniref:Septation ring formation regulator EzrA n=2 Tax=cellular organisms TaxID=131567 RepID=A0A0A3JVV6_9BACL|nr:septation ring formation regulator EzrA [Ureibacillus massiliensis]KGR91152.1 selenide, water dikinase [Ureibacillus massiliensis 4400831 = CIP 108448 = CCUG 49529]
MKYIITIVIVLIALLVAGILMRRKHNVIIQRLEQEKLQIQHYPIFEELTKIKTLNMNGETEKLFEAWRDQWTEVIDVHVLKIDSMLFDAEDYIDRFNFKKASQIEKDIEEYNVKCDKIKSQIITELEDLIGSEEKSRIEMEQLKEYYRSARKTLLAHQHSFGQALPMLEKILEEVPESFERYDNLTKEGNYLQAREIVLSLNTQAQQLDYYINEIPSLITEIHTKIPNAIQDLKNGQKEMEDQSYYLRHLELTEALENLEKELEQLNAEVINLNISNVTNRVQEINDEIDQYYDMLELEVIAKNFVDKNCENMYTTINEVLRVTKEVSDEAAYVQNSYQISEEEAEIPKIGLKQLEMIQKRYELLATRVKEEQSAYSSLQQELIEISEEIDKIKAQQEEFSDRLKNLRINEIKAREQLNSLKKLLQNTDRLLQKANIPGVPAEMEARIEEAEEQIFIVIQCLQEVPLNMNLVHVNLQNAQKSIQEVHERAKEMIENVLLIERIIQYGNRYRASNPTVNQQLLEAEEAFHQFRYIKALEDAVNAVELAEPGAIKRIEELVQDELYSKS